MRITYSYFCLKIYPRTSHPLGQLSTSSSPTLRRRPAHGNPSVFPSPGQPMARLSSVASQTTSSVCGPSFHKPASLALLVLWMMLLTFSLSSCFPHSCCLYLDLQKHTVCAGDALKAPALLPRRCQKCCWHSRGMCMIMIQMSRDVYVKLRSRPYIPLRSSCRLTMCLRLVDLEARAQSRASSLQSRRRCGRGSRL